MSDESNVIVSWKEIAHYLSSGVRTVQRWEQECSLPVHRPKGDLRGTVIALKSELDQWASQCLTRSSMTPSSQTDRKATLETANLAPDAAELPARAPTSPNQTKCVPSKITFSAPLDTFPLSTS